ncbi:hypothetical protein KIN20_009125 [Parelaphostrongylus tenuis]|uniref:Uncharacterized protein n=1 Tax=Parelaphostrongylus tenuis TaxID=148309 RepID=A0AAD5QL29_PARTN|nr:hypothetical protein KIN20_009125 [Parelaphostrongylus tenuis]
MDLAECVRCDLHPHPPKGQYPSSIPMSEVSKRMKASRSDTYFITKISPVHFMRISKERRFPTRTARLMEDPVALETR